MQTLRLKCLSFMMMIPMNKKKKNNKKRFPKNKGIVHNKKPGISPKNNLKFLILLNLTQHPNKLHLDLRFKISLYLKLRKMKRNNLRIIYRTLLKNLISIGQPYQLKEVKKYQETKWRNYLVNLKLIIIRIKSINQSQT